MESLGRRARPGVLALFAALLGSHPVPALEVTPIDVPGITEAHGIDYRFGGDRAYFAELGLNEGDGKLWSIDMETLTASVVGSGYTYPYSVAFAADGKHLYISEYGLGGSVLRVDVKHPDRADATVVASNFDTTSTGRMSQIALDEAHGFAYVVKADWPDYGIWRVNLSTGAKTLVVPAVAGSLPFGLLIDRSGNFAYVSYVGTVNAIKRVNLGTGSVETLATSAHELRQLYWANPDQTAIDVTSATGLQSLDLTKSLPELTEVAPIAAAGAWAVVRVAEDHLMVTAASEGVYDVRLSDYDAAGPILLGIGLVPADRINPQGYADTTVDPGATFQVKDAPFGGTLSIMMNYVAAFNRPLKARWYQILVDGVPQDQPWSDYRWDPGSRRFVLETMTPRDGGLFEVRNPRDLWYTPWLAGRLNTSHLGNGLHTLSIKLFTSRNVRHEVGSDGDEGRSAKVRIDNLWPVAKIQTVRHEGTDVSACAIVHGDCADDHFGFCITASDGDEHLMGWTLRAQWGDGQSQIVAQESYTPPGPLWFGRTCDPADPPPDPDVPSPPWEAYIPGDPSSARCAYTFALAVSDRAINGYGYIHAVSHQRSLTIELSNCP